ncbi:hypothetical protein NQ317_013281 [Molorchus minor]|uniref:Proton-coupled folate transporter n=1 Tax=Molorchus minor TaxID=1323400 RepID=A0ABQ9JS14_9CUCU|nr:hypothetical protein NQ317_013281 [Molorchus minor]
MASATELVTDSVADLTEKKDEKTFWQLTFKEKASYVREIITVEPLVTAYIMASVLCRPALVNLEYEKACRVNLNYNDTVCDAILQSNYENYTNENDEVQFVVSNMHSWQQPVESIVPLILVLFLGSYSDRHKWRKPLLLFPIIGEFFAVVGCILCVVFMKSWPIEAQGIAQTVVPSLTGGQTMMVMAVFAYIADVSTVDMRTLRIGVIQITLNVCTPVVQLISGVAFQEIGYYGVLLIAAVFYTFALLYGIFYIREPKQPIKSTEKGILCDIFDPRHAIDTFNLVLKKNPANNRTYIFIVLLTIFIYSGVNSGESNCFYLYVQRELKWTVVEFSYFITVNIVIHLVGTIVGIPLLTKVFKFSDPMILMVTLADKIVCNLFLGFAKTDTVMYAGIIVSLLTGITAVAIRSLATKIVSENDLGKAQSLSSIVEGIAPAVATPIYGSVIYNNTIKVFPAAFFLLWNCSLCYLHSNHIKVKWGNSSLGWLYLNQRSAQKKADFNENVNGAKDKDIPMDSYVQTTHIEPRVREKFNKNCILADIFDPTHAVDTFKLLFKENPKKKTYITTVIATVFVYRCAFDGESNVLYLYTQNVFQWTPVEYSYFSTINGVVYLVGNVLGVPLFTKILHLSDLMILFITIINKIITNIIFGLANTVPIFYIGVFCNILTGVYKVAKKSIATKIVSEDDVGKAQSLIGICEALAPAASVPIYNKLVYINMLEIYPAAFFFFSILFYGICCMLIIWMFYRKNRLKENGSRSNKSLEFIETIHM